MRRIQIGAVQNQGVFVRIISNGRAVSVVLTQHIGGIIAGIGVLFIGMGMMSDSMMPLRDSEGFVRFMTQFSNPILGILAGAAFTAVIQSSSASVGILQALAKSGVVTLDSAVYVLFGQNIGTCITAVLASIGTTRNAKRTTIIHLSFNIIGTIVFVGACQLLPFVEWMTKLAPGDPVAQIANVHTIFNITTTVLLLPFGTQLARLATWILPDGKAPAKDADKWFEDLMASKHHLGVSTIAISQIQEEIREMVKTAGENVRASFKTLEEGMKEEGGISAISEREEELDLTNVRLSQKISKILVLDQTPKDVDTLNQMYTVLGNVERIGDHAMNLAEYAVSIQEKNLSFSAAASQEIRTMEEVCGEAVELLEKAAEGSSVFSLAEAAALEQKMDDITEEFRKNQIARMRKGGCSVETSILYSEMLTDFERIGDHMLNIAQAYDAMGRTGADQTAAAAG